MTFQRLSALLLTALLAAAPLAAADPGWTPLGPFGGAVISLTAPDDPGRSTR